MRTEDSPYYKAMLAAPTHFRGIPRRNRVVVFTIILCISLFLLLPGFDLGFGRSWWFPLGRTPFDVLQFVDPLIGTANGGKLRSHAPRYDMSV